MAAVGIKPLALDGNNMANFEGDIEWSFHRLKGSGRAERISNTPSPTEDIEGASMPEGGMSSF